jgi:hypothetical protein
MFSCEKNAPRVISSGSEPEVKLSPVKEVTGSNLLCPLEVRLVTLRATKLIIVKC